MSTWATTDLGFGGPLSPSIVSVRGASATMIIGECCAVNAASVTLTLPPAPPANTVCRVSAPAAGAVVVQPSTGDSMIAYAATVANLSVSASTAKTFIYSANTYWYVF